MIKKFNQYNESLRDKMVGVSTDEIKLVVDKINNIVHELRKLGVYADSKIDNIDDIDSKIEQPIIIGEYTVMGQLHSIVKLPTWDMADDIKNILSYYSGFYNDLYIDEPTLGMRHLSLKEGEDLIKKIKEYKNDK